MKFKNFELNARPFLSNAYCECGERLKEVSSGWFSKVWFCKECDNVYQLELRKIPKKKISIDFLAQYKREAT